MKQRNWKFESWCATCVYRYNDLCPVTAEPLLSVFDRRDRCRYCTDWDFFWSEWIKAIGRRIMIIMDTIFALMNATKRK